MKISKQVLNFFFLLVLFCAAVPMMRLAFSSVQEYIEFQDSLFYKENMISIFYIIIMPGLFCVTSLFAAFKIFKIIKKNESVLSSKHRIRSLLLSIPVLLSLLVIYILFNESPPHYFPFNDPLASYTISKYVDWENMYYVHYKSTSQDNKSYNCSWEQDGKKTCRWEINNDISGVVVGKSLVALEPFLNKNLKIDGEFAYADQQCIVNLCKNFQRRLVVNIKSIEAISSAK